MDLYSNPLIDTLIATLSSPAVLVFGLLVAVALSSGAVARSVEVVEDRVPVRAVAGTRSRVSARPDLGA